MPSIPVPGQLPLFPLDKRCSKCGQSPPHVTFGKNRAERDGLHRMCKVCVRDITRARRAADPDHNKAVQRSWQERNRARCAGYTAKYRATHRDELAERKAANIDAVRAYNRECMRRWRMAHPARAKEVGRARYARNIESRRTQARECYRRHRDAYLAASIAYRETHKDSVRVYDRAYYEKNRERPRAQAKDYAFRHRDRRRAHLVRYRTRMLLNGGFYTVEEWRDLCDRYGHRCLRCNRNDVDLTADHIIPVSRGGTSWIDNIQPLCKSCNSAKGARTIDYRLDQGTN